MSREYPEETHWRPLRQMLRAMDEQIEELYRQAGMSDVRSRFVGPILRLSKHEPLSIRELASAFDVTHSAMSQTVSAMRKAGLVLDADNEDGRTRRIKLTPRAWDLVSFLDAEWRATEAAVRELDGEVPYPLSRVVQDIQAALATRSFRQRLEAHLDLP